MDGIFAWKSKNVSIKYKRTKGVAINTAPAMETDVSGKKSITDTEEALLPKEEGPISLTTTWVVLFEEVKMLGIIAGPMIAITLTQNLLQIVSMMMVGHLDELALSSSAIAFSLPGITGFSVLMGMACALETLCGQAYGAKQYQRLGTQTYTAIFSLTLLCIPLSILWIFMGKILVLVGQDPMISHEAGKFIMWLIPVLFSCAILQLLFRYFQTQNLIMPMLISSGAALCFHIPLCWALVFKSGLQSIGGALAICISDRLNAIILVLFIKYSSVCAEMHPPISTEIFNRIGEFFRLAVPSALMICLEWWSFELLILLSSLLPNPQLETSVLSVCLMTFLTLNAIPYGVGATASTRVSNELGAGNSLAALIAFAEAIVVSTILFACRRVFGYVFSNEKEVVDYVTTMSPLVCFSVIMDSLQGVLSGVARGCGWQHTGAYINLGAFYICGIPVAAVLGFLLQLRGMGLWIGILAGAFTQTVLLAIVASCTNWEKQAIKAKERIFGERVSANNGLI